MRTTLTLLALLAGLASASADDFVLDNVVIASGDVSYKAARLDVTGSALSRDATQALLADERTPPSERWSKVSAARIVAAEITSGSSAAGASQTVTYRDAVFEDVVAGRIGRANAAGATFSIQTPDGGTIAGRAGAIALTGIDMPGLAHIMVEGRANPDEAARTIIASGTIDAVEVDLPGGASGRIGKVVLANAGGRALAVPMTSLVDIAPRPDAPPPGPERRRALSGLAADMLTSQSLGSLELSDVEVRAAASDSAKVKAAGVSLSGVGKGLIARIGINGFAIEGGGPTSLSFDRFALTGVDLTPVLSNALKDDGAMVAAPLFDRLEVGGVAYVMSGVGQPLSLKIASAALNANGWNEGVPQALGIAVDHLAFDLPIDDPRSRPLLDLGYKRLDLSLTTTADYDTAKSELAMKTFRLSGPELGALDLTALLSSVGPDVRSRDPEKVRTALTASLFRRATVIVTDGGLLGRMIEAQARRSGGNVADTRARWATAVRANVMAVLAENPDRGTVADAAERFVRNGGRLSVTADTANGLGVIDAMLAGGAGPLLGKLKFTVAN